jgi:hypothetical protein
MGGIASAAGSIADGFIGNSAAITAANAEAGGYDSAINTAQNVYNTNSANYTPYINSGAKANQELSNETGTNGALGRQFTQTDFHQDPGYQFDMQQGLSAISNSNSVRGGALSGGSQKSMSNYGEQQASNEFNNARNYFTQNQNQNYSQLSGLSQQGLSATQGLGQLGSQYSTSVGNSQIGIGNVMGQEALGKASAQEGAINGFTSSLGGQQTGYSGSGLSQIVGLFSS